MDRDTLSWYETYAEYYIERTDSFEPFHGLERDLLAFVGYLASDALVVDLGSGAGRDARFIAASGHPVIAVDASRSLLRRCLTAAGPTLPIFGVNADLLALPFADNTIGGIWACGSLLHMLRDEIPAVVTRCLEILQPGAPIGLSMKQGHGSERRDDGRYFTYTNKQEMYQWLSSSGFERILITGPSRNDWLLAFAVKPMVY
ncbi:class I SAM-dependent methyltransferase [Nocardia transvalensis]|uniref:class I SAM-dependent methyltransferase n=1 Tax=Nocardia transvalensis TaxID=37333 RepID=UPI001893A64E|nr:class I SAM-dependent methyltransferase [Nocardia transvalensis]MBF6330628.1 class I SAM-dependent methyltransferase [Nocardia transvalensis]